MYVVIRGECGIQAKKRRDTTVYPRILFGDLRTRSHNEMEIMQYGFGKS